MRSVRHGLLIMVVALPLMAAGCGGQPSAASLAPSPEPGVVRTEVTPAATDIVVLETLPVQVRLKVEGELPNPCSHLAWYVKPGDDQGRIEVALYADQSPDTACIQVVAPYSESIPIGAFERGSYAVFLNDQKVEEFVLP
jgi:hypothetical protein